MLGPEHVGKRVAIRISLSDGAPGRRFTDILGQLVAFDDTTLTIDRDGEQIIVERSHIVAGKPIPPKPTRRPRRKD
ncbi:hypothetical protein [Natronoglycomyces albus]|uniref:Histone acetyltransferase Rv0428c-like SH3 domain-containing protein n=1 Tax=Natronoglycomyces albus TaxID=2811108 RepID=A0A895XM37_9ACTN|nr:hypothetical protein [Natronoglycomyces albus]QSB04603.1 hypothetical protein JQS30_12590 [Natronoglycomyces albus]